MWTAAARRRIAALREPRRSRRIALTLWIVWAILAWNVVFDHVIVVAGRAYLAAAYRAAKGGGPYARMDDWMRPAVTHGVWLASAAAAAILLVGVMALRLTTPRDRARGDQSAPQAGS
jgi:hypothetical protein